MGTCTHPIEGTTTWTPRANILPRMDSLTTGNRLDIPKSGHVAGRTS